MKIQCNVCELAEANVLCCADQAALCWACDHKVHAANKLASMHQRVPLTTSASQIPNCDICQETVGYFFCLEDRALLCRKCDVAIHTANTFVSSHQRFLLTGVKVGLQPAEPGPSSSSGKSHSRREASEKDSHAVPSGNVPVVTSGVSQESHSPYSSNIPMLSDGQLNKMQSMQIDEVEDFAQTRLPFSGGSAVGTIPPWHLDDFLGLSDFSQSYGYMGNGSSKADNGKLGDSDDSSILRAGEKLDGDECLGQVPDSHWAVPQVSSPPTASGLYLPKSHQNQLDAAIFVPVVCHLQMKNFNRYQPSGSSLKRRRQMILYKISRKVTDLLVCMFFGLFL